MVRRLLRIYFLLLALGATRAVAESDDSRWSVKKWDLDDGMSGLVVTGIAQTRDGYLWVAARTVLSRFDGVRFDPFPSTEFAPGSARGVRAMIPDRSGGLWLAIDPSELVHLGNGPARVVTMPIADVPTSLVEDATGTLWASYHNGVIYRVQGAKAENVSTAPGFPRGRASVIFATDSAGQVWWTKNRVLGTVQEGRFKAVASIPEGGVCMVAASHGGLWLSIGAALYRFEGGTLKSCGEFLAHPDGFAPTAVLESRDGAVWIGMRRVGLYRFQDGQFEEVDLSDRNCSALTEDHEGNIWVGTNGGGLRRVQPRACVLEGTDQGLPSDMLRSICQDVRGTIWAASQDGMLMRRVGERWETVIGREHRFGGGVASVAADRSGAVWVGTTRGALLRWQAGDFEIFDGADFKGRRVPSLFVSQSGDVWMSVEGPDALVRVRGHTFEKLPLARAYRRLRVHTEDSAGNLWVTADHRLLRLTGNQTIDETGLLAAVQKPIRSLLATPDGSLWIGFAGAGLGRLKNGQFGLLGMEAGLHDDHIDQLIADGLGWIWIGSNHGVFKVAQQELADAIDGKIARVRSTVYGHNVGLTSQPAVFESSPSTLRSRDGRLWFSLRDGVAIISPQRLPQEPSPPTVRVTEVTIDGKAVASHRAIWAQPRGLELGAGHALLNLPPAHRRLDVAFTALTFRSPENVQFRYRLEGYDDAWIDAGTQRTASYPRLAAGNYRFRVSAANSDGVWNEAGATLAFAVEPFMWQRWWFRTGALLVFTGLVVALVRYVSYRRLRARLLALEKQVAIERERARIARDIHDDLGGSLTQIALLSDRALRERDTANPTAEIAKISARVHEGIRSLDEIVWAINPSNDNLEHLVDYIGQFAVDFLRVAGIPCQIDLPVALPACALSAEARHGVFLAVKETLNNIVRHAQASEVTFRATLDATRIELTIVDNGRGFEVTTRDTFANGISNLQQRMRELGGSYTVESAIGNGTRVLISLPLTPAAPGQNECPVAIGDLPALK